MAVGWVDNARLYDALDGAVLPDLAGRAVVGLHATTDAVEVEGLTFGAANHAAKPPPNLLTRLPADTVAAAFLSDADAVVTSALSQLPNLLGVVAEEGGGDTVAELIADITNNLADVLGTDAVLALGSVPAGEGPPELALVSNVTEIPAADAAVGRLRGLAARNKLSLRARRLGGTLYLGFGDGYVDRLLREEGLGQVGRFRTALGELGDDVTLAAYVDIAALTDAQRGEPGYPDVQPFEAFGLVAGHTDGHGFLRVRLVLR